MSQTTLVVRPDEPIGTISPRLYGHFAEHLGRCCYGGLWSGDRFRADVVAALRELPVPLLRWPGGCYADHYHWRDGIGPANTRPRRLGMSCGEQVEDDNSVGTHEFLNLCQTIGAEPYLAGNVGSGTPQEMCDWLEYCNSRSDTTLTRERRANGAEQPFGVSLWGVGNENWGCGGNFDPVSYGHEYRRFATMLRHVDPSAELVACGLDDAWNERLLEVLGKAGGVGGGGGMGKLIDHLSIHRYWGHGGPAVDFTDTDYYSLLGEAHATEAFVVRTAELIRAAMPPGRRVGVALDEWGVWHPEARLQPQDCADCPQHSFEQRSTLRDALAAGVALEGFVRQCNVLSMANLAQVVNVLQAVVVTDGPRMFRTPTYYALQLHAPHMGATALPVDVISGDALPDSAPAVSGIASRSPAGLAVTLVNRHRHAVADVCLVLGGAFASAFADVLTADSPAALNSVHQPERVVPRRLAVTSEGRTACRLELPQHSMATLRLA
ncbi:MAG TPA: alpha-L-arabinofuranosidase C-terminal domain-containing protein [Chloroflexota bacterium]|nr:alpha-L-arabinofuranosidase C-terminal domain-containing protein [Chloroflexota bacterium]